MTTATSPTAASELLLPGLDGTNPLGFLAALGAFRILSQSRPYGRASMKWTPRGGTWIPCLCDTSLSVAEFLDVLVTGLHKSIDEHPVRQLEETSEESSDMRRQEILEQIHLCSSNRRCECEWISALSSDIVPPDATNQLQTARRDYHFGNLTSIIRKTTRDHLTRAVFAPWDYADSLDNQSLHIDPSEDRRHAYQWNKPAGDPNRKKNGGMLGANRLAIEAIPIFTSLPDGKSLRTLGFYGKRRDDTRWTWPIWNVPVRSTELQTILGIAILQDEHIGPRERIELASRGIVSVFRSHRILVEKTPNFTPAQRIA